MDLWHVIKTLERFTYWLHLWKAKQLFIFHAKDIETGTLQRTWSVGSHLEIIASWVQYKRDYMALPRITQLTRYFKSECEPYVTNFTAGYHRDDHDHGVTNFMAGRYRDGPDHGYPRPDPVTRACAL